MVFASYLIITSISSHNNNNNNNNNANKNNNMAIVMVQAINMRLEQTSKKI